MMWWLYDFRAELEGNNNGFQCTLMLDAFFRPVLVIIQVTCPITLDFSTAPIMALGVDVGLSPIK